MEKQTANIENMENMDQNIYEVSYILLPTFSTEEAPAKASQIKEKISSFGAKLISDEDPVLIDLAYPMMRVVQTVRHKADKGYFGWVKFEISKDQVKLVKKYFDDNADVLRHLIIKTVAENTLLNGKMKLKSDDKQKRSGEIFDEASEVMADAEVRDDMPAEESDKLIDDLVTA